MSKRRGADLPADIAFAIRVMEAEEPVARRRLEGAEGIERGSRVLHNERFENLPGGEAQVWTNGKEAERLARVPRSRGRSR